MGFLNYAVVWGDVLNRELDEKTAPSLGGVRLGIEPRIYSDPLEFFKRTLITRHMTNALLDIVSALSGEGGDKVHMLLSLFGGGKTHTLITIYHAFQNLATLSMASAEDSETRETINKIIKETSKLGNIRIVVIDGYYSTLAPTPVNPLTTVEGYRIQTLWGSIAYQLGLYNLVQQNDEKLIAPPADVISRLFLSNTVLILIDELASYIVNLITSGDPGLRDYANQVISFMEYLAKAVEISKSTVLIISFPIEPREQGGEIIEGRYRAYRDIIMNLFKSISRVAFGKIAPVSYSDIPSILKIRIFEKIDSRIANTVASTLSKIYSAEENKEILGEEAVKIAQDITKTYPYHPSYISSLINILEKHEGLQKTRDAIRITRQVVRKLYNENSTAELIMPFHIDIEDREISHTLLSHPSYQQYSTVVQEDVIERSKGYERPELAKLIAKVIFLRTFVYADSTRYHKLYPDKHEIIISSFEPNMARALNLQLSDYVSALEWMSSNLAYLLSEGDRYWFTQITSPIRRVEITARTVEDYDAINKIENYTWKLLSKPYTELISGSKKRRQEAGIRTAFYTASSKVMREPRLIDHDSRYYILVAILSPVAANEVEKIIYRTESGGLRNYANTVYLVYPRDSDSFSQMISLAKSLIACDLVVEELNTIYVNEEIREVMRRKLEKYCRGMEGVEGKLLMNILNGLNKIAYPTYDVQKQRNTYKTTDTSTGEVTIVEAVTRALKSDKPPKFYEELDFDELEYMLSQIGIDLSKGPTARKVSDVIDFFYSNPRLPMILDSSVKDALIDGLSKLSIGIKKGDKTYFKKIHVCSSKLECRPPARDEAEIPQEIELTDLIVPWEIALKEQLGSLKKEEERVIGGIRRIWYAFHIDNNFVQVAEALEKYDFETLRRQPLVRITEFIEEGVDLKLDKYEITVSPDEEIIINGLIERVGFFRGALKIIVSDGLINPEKISIGDEVPSVKIEWRIKAPKEPGTYSYEIKILKTSQEILTTGVVKLLVKPRAREVITGVPPKGTKISVIDLEVDSFNLKPIDVIANKFGSSTIVEKAELRLEAKMQDKRPKLRISLEDILLEDLKSIFMSIISRYGPLLIESVCYKIEIRPHNREYVEAPEFSEDEMKSLKDYLRYYVFEEVK
ncbi:MAG: DUF499 domain-containing protein [Infirmifilum sp.]